MYRVVPTNGREQQKALEAVAVAYAEADLSESERLRDRGELNVSAAALERAKDRLREFVPRALHDRLSTAFDNLELVTRLDGIRTERTLIKPRRDRGAEQILSVTSTLEDDPAQSSSAPARTYEDIFRQARIGAPGDDPAVVAARVRASQVRGALVAALDDWSACATDQDQQVWVLAVVRHADPDYWRDRVRDRATWDDTAALRDLADKAPLAEQSPHLLAILGARLRARKIDAEPLLGRVVTAYPADFWVNVEMGNTLFEQSNLAEAIGYYRAALALRPETVSVPYALGGMYLSLHRWDQAIAEFEQAIRVDQNSSIGVLLSRHFSAHAHRQFSTMGFLLGITAFLNQHAKFKRRPVLSGLLDDVRCKSLACLRFS